MSEKMDRNMCSCEPPQEVTSWQGRMIEEYCELKQRYEKLHKIIVKMEAGRCDFSPKCPLELLKRQAKAMGEYLYVLEIRAEIEQVSL